MSTDHFFELQGRLSQIEGRLSDYEQLRKTATRLRVWLGALGLVAVLLGVSGVYFKGKLSEYGDDLADLNSQTSKIGAEVQRIQDLRLAEQVEEAVNEELKRAQESLKNVGEEEEARVRKIGEDYVRSAFEAEYEELLSRVSEVKKKTDRIKLRENGNFDVSSGIYDFAMQADGNLVIYKSGGGHVWASGSAGR